MNQFDRLFAESGLSLERMRTFLAVVEAGNIAKAARGDATRQSQFSRQVKELEGYFGVPLTRRIGRRIEVTAEGRSLARLIRQHFAGLDDFRESMSGRPVAARLGAPASVLEWMVMPKFADCREAVGNVILELEQLRTAEVVRGVSDGRLDFGVVREDAAPSGMKRLKLGKIGFGLFASKKAWKTGGGIEGIFATQDFGEVFPGGAFHRSYVALLAKKNWRPRVIARVGSFLPLARLARCNDLAAVLPLTAAVEFEGSTMKVEPLVWEHERAMVLLANARSLERAGIRSGSVTALAETLRWKRGNL